MHLGGVTAEDKPGLEPLGSPDHFLPLEIRPPDRFLRLELAKGFEPPTL